ncbi:hypothetical protein [Enterobacter hormaechei]|uniref:hypothetical protein n=1 Tax=Enterobacter hormaechei TaxID=158836 RepID=UPI0033148383
MDIELLPMSISALAVAISVYAAVSLPEQNFKQIKHTPRDQLPPGVRKLIENVDELERRVKLL